MKKITINIPDNKYSFFLELVKNLGLEKEEEPVKKLAPIIHKRDQQKSMI